MKIKFFSLIFIILIVISACKKTEVTKGTDGRGKTIVVASVPNATNGYALQAIDVSDNPQSFPIIEFVRNVPNQDELNKALTVTVIFDTTALVNYNVANGTSLEFLPDSVFNFSGANKSGNSLTITFQPGEFGKSVVLNFPKTTNLDLSKKYALGFTLLNTVSGSDAIVSANGSRSGVVQIALKNKYDGIYEVHSYIVRYSDPATIDTVKTGHPPVFKLSLITTGANTVKWTSHTWKDGLFVGGIDPVYFAINPVTDSVTITSGATQSIPLANRPGYQNIYDPLNKKFFVSYTWGTAAGPRYVTDTLVYVGSR